MRIDTVKGLVIHQLRQLGIGSQSDRRGPVCDLLLADIPNTEHAIDVAVRVIQRVCSLMDDSYFWSDKRDKGPTEFHEQFESWIDPLPLNQEGKAVRLTHKYWSQTRIDKFLDIMVTLAHIHGWTVDDRRKVEPSIEEAEAQRDAEDAEFLEAVGKFCEGEDVVEAAEQYIDSAYQMNTSPWRLLALDAIGICHCSEQKEGFGPEIKGTEQVQPGVYVARDVESINVIPIRRKP